MDLVAWVILAMVAALLMCRHQGRPDVGPLDVRALTAELLRAAAARHPDDARISRAAAAVLDVQPLTEDLVDQEKRTVRRGKFERDVGVLRLATTRSNGTDLPPAIVRGILVHEVAHAGLPDGRHTPEWRDLFVKLLRVATDDLGWDVLLECGSCKFYGVCSADECPRCAWKPCRDPHDERPRKHWR